MNISSVSFGNKVKAVDSKEILIDYRKPDGGIPKDIPDNEVVAHCRLDNTYVYPITAGDVRAKARAAAEICSKKEYVPLPDIHQETPEEDLSRKIYSTEWCM